MKSNKPRLVFICDTVNFKQFTRRATTEAIAKIYSNSIAFCNITIREYLSGAKNKDSDFIKTQFFIRFFPLRLLNNRFFNLINLLFNKLLLDVHFNKNDILIFLTPNQVFLSRLLRKNKSILVLSDPYHILGYSFDYTKELMERADFIVATSIALTEKYPLFYFNHTRSNVYYWPNCVDLSIWNIKDINTTKDNVILGFAGNILDIVDLDLLDYITNFFPDVMFEIGGKNLLKDSANILKFETIIKKENVSYLGLIPYEELPARINTWNIGLLLDIATELTYYVHHNKIYQYLALGIPVVFQRNISDYDVLNKVALSATNKEEFVENIREILTKVNTGYDFSAQAIILAKENSSEIRAQQFCDFLKFKFEETINSSDIIF